MSEAPQHQSNALTEAEGREFRISSLHAALLFAFYGISNFFELPVVATMVGLIAITASAAIRLSSPKHRRAVLTALALVVVAGLVLGYFVDPADAASVSVALAILVFVVVAYLSRKSARVARTK